MMRVKSYLWLLATLLLLSLLIVACEQTEPPTVVPEPSKTPKPTFTPIPTATSAPTATPLPPTPTVEPSPTVDPYVNPLTGRRVDDPSVLQRSVLAVRVGNDAAIRPQDGLGAADIVYEELMEGWTLTRFTAIYLGGDAERLRPIRSARLSSLAIAPQYNAVLVHSGASDRIRWLISQADDFTDLDQWFHGEPYSILPGYDWRGRVYTSTERVHQYLLGLGMEDDQSVTGYAFDATAPIGETAINVRVPYPRVCTVDWAYDATSGAYLRTVAGESHEEGLTGEQLRAENVIVLYAEHRKTDIIEDDLGSTAIDIVLTGSGQAQIFRDGVALDCTWQRPDDGGLIQCYDDAGGLVPLKPGQTWIELVPPDYEIVFN